MKSNYFIYIILLGVILFRSSLLHLTNNLTSFLFIKDISLEKYIIDSKSKYYESEYQKLLSFENSINIKYDYKITNVLKTHYGFHNLIVSGKHSHGNEVVNENGLVGIINKTYSQNSEVNLLYNTNLVVNINNNVGKITGQDNEGNLIIKELSNYNNIKLNDIVYSVYQTYIGKVIKINYDIIDNYLTVKPVDVNNLDYVAVIRRS